MPRVRSTTQDWRNGASGRTPGVVDGVVFDKPALAAEDLLVAVLWCDQQRAFAAPANQGWQQVVNEYIANYYRFQVFTKPATDSEPTSYNFTTGTSEFVRLGILCAVQEAASALNAVASRSTEFRTRTVSTNDITTSVENALLLAVFGTAEGGTLTPPSGMTERNEIGSGVQAIAVNDQSQVLISSTGEKTTTLALESYYNAAAILAVGPSPLPPNQPPLERPVNGATINLAGTPHFVWRFSDPNTNDTQQAWAFRRKVGTAAYEYWNAATLTWQATVVWNPGTDTFYTFPAAKWANGVTYNWSVATQDQTGRQGPFNTDNTVSGGTAPTVTVTGPTSPETKTTRPVVPWTYADAENHAQAQYRVRVFRASVYSRVDFRPDSSEAAWDSGLQTSSAARSVVVGEDLENNQTYRAYVQVTDSSGMPSTWQYHEFVLQVPLPAAPTIQVTANHGDAVTSIQVQGQHSKVEYPEATVRVEASDDDGATWQIVRGGDRVPYDPALRTTVSDYEGPPHAPRAYRARTLSSSGAAVVASSPSAVISVTIQPQSTWLKVPGAPARNRRIVVREWGAITKPEERGFFEPLGREDPIITHGVLRSDRSSMRIYAANKAQREDVEALIRSQMTLLLQVPAAYAGEEGEQWYLQVSGDPEETRISPKTKGRIRDIEFEWAEVRKP